ncbi:MAG: nitrate/sulfonate/bicarbonate ABC transporter ATP-binding protein [Leptothrix sp. (in: Bacteria)]|nr:nitrate/sulfonate/bicarbonate ABC transporter ATP-binding protein [Leptothrix sp. (in: b-proteobacteria)]
MNGPRAVELIAAEKTYANGTQALRPVDLTVAEGEFVTLLGPSGCGKSTLLKMAAGLLAPSAGEVRRWGRPVAEAGAEAGADVPGIVFQEATLMPWARVDTNVRLPLDLAAVPRAEADERVRQALQLVGLERFARHRPHELSGGMRMRVAIARALVTRPRLLLMDEPFGALDEITRNRLDAELLALWQQQRLTVVFVTHSIHEAVFLSRRVLVMAARPGRVVDEVAIDEPHPRQPAFRVSTSFSRHAEQLQVALLQASGGVDDEALA